MRRIDFELSNFHREDSDVESFEKNDRFGKKILATGNGKCNITNKIMSSDDFNSQYRDVYSDYISHFNNHLSVIK